VARLLGDHAEALDKLRASYQEDRNSQARAVQKLQQERDDARLEADRFEAELEETRRHLQECQISLRAQKMPDTNALAESFSNSVKAIGRETVSTSRLFNLPS
jgi:chromosome segregation ATPase